MLRALSTSYTYLHCQKMYSGKSKNRRRDTSSLSTNPSALIPNPLSPIPNPSHLVLLSLILHSLSLIPNSSSKVPYPSSPILQSPSLISHYFIPPLSLLHSSFIIPHPSCLIPVIYVPSSYGWFFKITCFQQVTGIGICLVFCWSIFIIVGHS